MVLSATYKQFADLDLNNLKPDMDVTATSANYLFKESRLNTRKTKIINAYKGRSTTRGRVTKIFNVEELATLWHFPIDANVRAPLIQKTPGRKAEAPMTLPLAEEEDVSEKIFEPAADLDEIFLDEKTGRAEPMPAGSKTGEAAEEDDDIFTLEDEAKAPEAAASPAPAEKEPAIVRESRRQSAAAAYKPGRRGVPPANLPF
jgi:hypothetical protein